MAAPPRPSGVNMEYIDGDIHETTNGLRLRIYACLNLDTKKLIPSTFSIFENHNDVTVTLKEFNPELHNRLEVKIRDHLIEQSKEDGAQL